MKNETKIEKIKRLEKTQTDMAAVILGLHHVNNRLSYEKKELIIQLDSLKEKLEHEYAKGYVDGKNGRPPKPSTAIKEDEE